MTSRMILGLAAIAGLAICSAARAEPPSCAYDRAAMLALDAQHFDGELDSGWHPIGARHGCEKAAAGLITDYVSAHAASLTSDELKQLYWHEGQLAAAIGDDAKAIDFMTRASASASDDLDRFYFDATIAFLRRDKAGLLSKRAQLAAIAQPPGFLKAAERFKARYGYSPVWPMNIDVVDGLVACFDKAYQEAYAFACRPKAADSPKGKPAGS